MSVKNTSKPTPAQAMPLHTNSVTPILSQNAFDGQSSNPLVQRRMKIQGAATMLFYPEPLTIERGQGAYLYDAEGRAYLDMYNNVPSVGHAHPKVLAAVNAQMEKVNVHSRYLHEGFVTYAERLFSTFASPRLQQNFLMTCTGSEANDLAIRLAQVGTGKKGVIVSKAAYHGNTALSSSVSPSALRSGELAGNVATFDIAGILAHEHKSHADDETLVNMLDSALQRAYEELNDKGHGCAAIIVDSIFSSDGIFVQPGAFLHKSIARLQAQGVLLIADEVQPGFARTGENFWGFESHELSPDIITMGKPMGNGYPCAGLICREALLEKYCRREGYFNTFGGSTVAVAAAQAVLDIIEEEGLQLNAKQRGDELKQGLLDLKSRYECIYDVRGCGLYIGVEVESAGTLVNALCQQGVLVGATGVNGNTLKIRPPLCLTESDVEQFLDRFEKVLS